MLLLIWIIVLLNSVVLKSNEQNSIDIFRNIKSDTNLNTYATEIEDIFLLKFKNKIILFEYYKSPHFRYYPIYSKALYIKSGGDNDYIIDNDSTDYMFYQQIYTNSDSLFLDLYSIASFFDLANGKVIDRDDYYTTSFVTKLYTKDTSLNFLANGLKYDKHILSKNNNLQIAFGFSLRYIRENRYLCFENLDKIGKLNLYLFKEPYLIKHDTINFDAINNTLHTNIGTVQLFKSDASECGLNLYDYDVNQGTLLNILIDVSSDELHSYSSLEYEIIIKDILDSNHLYYKKDCIDLSLQTKHSEISTDCIKIGTLKTCCFDNDKIFEVKYYLDYSGKSNSKKQISKIDTIIIKNGYSIPRIILNHKK